MRLRLRDTGYLKGVLPINNLIFLSDRLMSPVTQRLLNIPLEFITFAHIEGKMYTLPQNKGTFVLRGDRPWGNSVVYGALYLLQDFNFHIRTLDGMSLCSLSALRRNHDLDMLHRVELDAIPIHFDSINELERLLYTEGDAIRASAYIGNVKHPKIKQRVANHRNGNHRILDGVDKDSFLQLHREVTR